MSVADMMIETYTAESAVLRTLKHIKNKDSVNDFRVELTQLYVHSAVEKLSACGREAIYSFAEGDDQRLLLIGLKRLTGLKR